MAQGLVHDFMRDLVAAVELPDPVVEFGSLQVEPRQQGDLRGLFEGRDFTGTDLRQGPGVDRIEDLRSLRFGDGEVGTAICLDTLEHCEDPVQACRELRRVTAPGGVCVISSVMLFGIHGYPNDYFRFTPEAFRSMLAGFDDIWATGVGDPEIPNQVLGVGALGRRLELSRQRLPSLDAAQRRWEEAEGKVRVGPLRIGPRELTGIVARETLRNARRRLRRSVGVGQH